MLTRARINVATITGKGADVRTETGRILHEKGRILPVSTVDHGGGPAYAEELASVLRAELGGSRAAAKTVMRWTGAGERTAKTWLSGISGPSGEHLIGLIRHSDAVFALMLRLSGRTVADAQDEIAAVRSHLLDALAVLEGKATSQTARPKIDRR